MQRLSFLKIQILVRAFYAICVNKTVRVRLVLTYPCAYQYANNPLFFYLLTEEQ